MAMVSVIIPAFNVEDYIERCIISVTSQSLHDVEIIVINDGSTDNTLELVLNLAEKDSRIIVITQNNRGVSSARNRGIDVACGEYIIFLDADDWIEQDTIKKLLSNKSDEKNKLLCCGCYFDKLDENGNIIKECIDLGEPCLLDWEKSLAFVGVSSRFRLQSSCYKLFEKKIIDIHYIRFDEDIFYGEDGIFTLKYLLKVEGIKYFPEALWNILDREDSATHIKYNEKFISSIKAIDKMLDLASECANEKLIANLHTLKAERTLWVAIACIKSGEAQTEDYQYARKILYENKKFLLNKRTTIKSRLITMLIIYLPIKIVNFIYEKIV